jgi:hypothetical protein
MRRRPSAGLNLGFTEGAERADVERDRRFFFSMFGADSFALASLRQVHSSQAYQVMSGAEGTVEYRPCGVRFPGKAPQSPRVGDALVTNQPGILLSIRTADCLPVLLVDPKHRAVGAVHAGWRGALARIIEKAVGEMRRRFQTEPARLLAALGPSIRVCCYEVGEEVVEAFQGRIPAAESFFRRVSAAAPELDPACRQAYPPAHAPRMSPAAHLDLIAVASAQLRAAGLTPRHIFTSEYCTACRPDLFFSHRTEGAWTGRMMAVIGIRPG